MSSFSSYAHVELCNSIIQSLNHRVLNTSIFSELRIDSTGQCELILTSLLLSFLFPPLCFYLSLSICGSRVLDFLHSSLAFALSDHHRHQSDASLHLQPGPRAHRPRREAGRLLPGAGGVWGGETRRRTKTQGQESPCLTALADQIHRRRHGWVAHSRHLQVDSSTCHNEPTEFVLLVGCSW